MASTAAAVPLRVLSSATTSERRVSPAWSVAQLKARLEPITGVPIEFQRLVLHGEQLEVQDEEATLLGSLRLVPFAELQVRMTSCMAIRRSCVSCRMLSDGLLHSPWLVV